MSVWWSLYENTALELDAAAVWFGEGGGWRTCVLSLPSGLGLTPQRVSPMDQIALCSML